MVGKTGFWIVTMNIITQKGFPQEYHYIEKRGIPQYHGVWWHSIYCISKWLMPKTHIHPPTYNIHTHKAQISAIQSITHLGSFLAAYILVSYDVVLAIKTTFAGVNWQIK